jgi:hypothetical protein
MGDYPSNHWPRFNVNDRVRGRRWPDTALHESKAIPAPDLTQSLVRRRRFFDAEEEFLHHLANCLWLHNWREKRDKRGRRLRTPFKMPKKYQDFLDKYKVVYGYELTLDDLESP